MENLAEQIDVLIPIVREKGYKFQSFVMGYHEYRKIWTPKNNEILKVEMEPTNKMDKFAAAVIKDKKTIGHLPKGKTGRLSKTIYYFLKVENNNDCQVEILDCKAVNLGDGMGMRIPCTLLFSGQSDFIDILSNELCKHI